jgi:hypothetical protein
MRASAGYRLAVARNLLLRAFREIEGNVGIDLLAQEAVDG